MFVIIVYDTEKRNCVRLHKNLKRYLFWNQNSVFEGSLTKAQYEEVKQILKDNIVDSSHVVIYSMENEKLLKREELGLEKGNTSNFL